MTTAQLVFLAILLGAFVLLAHRAAAQ